MEREAHRAHEAQQMSIMRALAASHARVDAVVQINGQDGLVAEVELTLDRRRVVGRVAALACAALVAALEAGPVQLAATGRYGPFWTLTFEGQSAPLVLLVDRLGVFGRSGGAGGEVSRPARRLAG
jgi:hypothetical protein